MSSIATASDSSGYLPQPGQLIYFDKPSGQSVNLTPLLSGGAKFTVVFDLVCGKVSHPGKAGDAVYHRVKRQIERWEKDGLVHISHNVIDPLDVAQSQKRGLYVQTTVNLIKGMQNSNTFCKTDPPLTSEKYSLLHSQFPRRCGPRRREAIGTALRIRQYYLFKRPDPSRLNPHLAEKITRMENKFHRWEDECEEKRIILSRVPGAPPGKPYTILPMTTRFTNEGRKVELLKTYEKAIENTSNLFEDAVFLTFTTDPMIHLTPAGEPIQRVMKSKDGKKVLQVFNTTGRGTSLYEANRHESTAWRKWYEAETRRRGYRIPYIRVAEFMKNGLIHTHVILFGLSWSKPIHQLAKEWGEKYQQGFMVHAYALKNHDKKWTWKNEKNTPDDAQGKSPDDYLKKYLKKALYDTSSHWGYWVHNKRFYTMSQSIRYADAAEEAAAKAERRAKEKPYPEYEFIGAVPEDEIPDIIRRHSRGWQREEPVTPYEMPAQGTPDSPARYPGPSSWMPGFTPASQWKYNDPSEVIALSVEIAIPDPLDGEDPPASCTQDDPPEETYLEMIRRLKREAKEENTPLIQ